MEEKYGKLNKMFREKIKHPILPKKKKKKKKKKNQMFLPDFRGIQEILWKPTENKTVRDSWGNTDRV